MAPFFGLKGGWLTFWVTVACATDMMLFGYDQGVFGGVIVTEDFLDLLGIRNNPSLQSTVTSVYDLGCFLGALSVLWIGEPLGRKKTVMMGTAIMAIGAILQISASDIAQMIVGRVVAGIGNGINTSTAPVWQGETSKASWRGKLVVIEMILNIFGFMLSNWVTFGFSYIGGSAAWRVPLAVQFLFIFILCATVPWLPESPRWLITRDRVDEANRILACIEDRDVNDPYIVTQSREIRWAVQYERRHAVPWKDLLRGRTGAGGGTSTLRRVILGMGTQAMQQFSGINVTSYYFPLVLIQSVGLSDKRARLLAACNSVSYLLFSLIGIPNVEKWGRRRMMMYCAFGQGICYMAITICIRYNKADFLGPALQRQFAEASIAFFFLYYVFFGIGWQGVPWLYPTEINSLSMRTKGAALGTATNWIVNFMVVEITPPGIATLGWSFYIIWTVFNFAFIPIVYLFYPETAGRSLEDVDRFFQDNQDILIYKDKDATSSKRPFRYVERELQQVRRHSFARSPAGSRTITAAEIRSALQRSSNTLVRDMAAADKPSSTYADRRGSSGSGIDPLDVA
ncbi:general substrate transporter [Podospora didyma]|uniref:General substrate transporter n=1 Tax=Podospora didyma TaxID=330526 RepID=A0AAE0U7Y3_9PEZI|nr:general substrate transporter [Podospora didyma]